ncbi:M15 family metallopeptidase [Gracilibacillus xinjiangensis]|uniref:D-alanyl-D-alanine carboxypeptidase family protein n=1 Tax=Gracilibacillus xinjiangensis TaxID=1193282 RepID=A0ABV8WX21_9BACI
MRKIIYLLVLMGIFLIGCQNGADENKQPAEELNINEEKNEETTENAEEDLAEKEEETVSGTEGNNEGEGNNDREESPADTETEKRVQQDGASDEGETSEVVQPAVPDKQTSNESSITVVDDPNSVEVIVNKQRKLPDGYEPTDLVEPDVSFYAAEGDQKRLLRQVAATALEELFTGAEQSGLDFVAVSGYRSYDRQKVIYENNVANNGQEYADRYSAKPGTSEHQTGLAMDVASAALVAVLEPGFIQTAEGQWLAENAHKYGFIVRYLEGKESITGYSYEPWHIRYVGKEIAAQVYEQQTTLEEFFGLYP